MLITYITSHFGSAQDLRRCVDSVFRDFQLTNIPNLKLEHLIFLDGFKDSKDNYQFLSTYSHLRVFQSVHSQGKSHGVNYLLSEACGEFLFLLDSDDWNILGRTYYSLTYHNHLAVKRKLILGSNYLQWDRRSLFCESSYPLDNRTIKLKFWSFPYLLYSSICFHRELLDNTDFLLNESLTSGVDYELYTRILPMVDVNNLSRPLVVYTVSSDGMTRSTDSRAKQLLSHQNCLSTLLSIPDLYSADHLSRLIIRFLTKSLDNTQKDELRRELNIFTNLLESHPSTMHRYFPETIDTISLIQEFQTLQTKI